MDEQAIKKEEEYEMSFYSEVRDVLKERVLSNKLSEKDYMDFKNPEKETQIRPIDDKNKTLKEYKISFPSGNETKVKVIGI